MKLSVELEKWRADRPDEWKMDEFIRNAEKLEEQNAALIVKMQEQIEAGISERERCYNEITELEHLRDELASKVVSVQAERDALAAQVKALKMSLSKITAAANPESDFEKRLIDECKSTLAATPQQHLRELRAEAVTEAADKMGEAFILPANLRRETNKAEFYKAGWRDAFLFLKQYADSIRQEGK